MRTLTSTLQAAQQAPTGSPQVQCVLRARRGAASRIDPTTLYTDTQADTCVAVAQPANGNIVRARLSGGNVQTQSLAAASGSAWTTWTTLAAATVPGGSYGGLALAATGNTVTIAYLSAAGTVAIRDSTDDGVTWGAATTISVTAGNVGDVALAYAPSGDLLLVAGDEGGTVHAYRRASGGSTWTTEPTLIPPGATFINALALAYSGDWLLLVSWDQVADNYLGAAIYGNGGLQTANTWSSVTLVFNLAAGSGPSLVPSGFAWGADGGHALFVEQWAILGGYTANQSYEMICTSAANFKAGRFMEAAPFAYTNASGADIAASQVPSSTSYVAAGQNLVATLSTPADVDVSARLISLDLLADWRTGTLLVVLDNSDGTLSSLAAQSSIGQRLDVSLGFTTSAGLEVSQQPQRFVSEVTSAWSQGRQLLTLHCHDGWGLLSRLTFGREESFGPSLGLAALTVDQITAWLLMRAAVEYTAPAATTLNARTPSYTFLPGHQGHTEMAALLDILEGLLLFQSAGATTKSLATSEASVYTYANDGTHHPLIELLHDATEQPANLITVWIGAHGQSPGAQAFDTTSARVQGIAYHHLTDTDLEAANAQAVANALLRKAQISVPLIEILGPPNVAQELGDVVTVTDPITGTPSTGRIMELRVVIDFERGLWEQTLVLGVV